MKLKTKQKDVKFNLSLVTRHLPLIVTLTLLFTLPVKAQVNIGKKDESPKAFSLLELNSNERGLRMPQLTTDQRDSISNIWDSEPKFEGLVIYNTDNKCLEYWGGLDKEWVSLCADVLVDCNTVVYPALKTSYDFASTANAKVSDLITDAGSNVLWYDNEEDITPLLATETLTSKTYYAEQKIGSCTNPERVPVTVTISTAAVANIVIDACVNTMYDFQYQTLTAYSTTGGAATQFQWYAKRRGQLDTEYKPIPGATAVSYKINADFVKDVFRPLSLLSGTDYNDSIVFIVKAWNILNITPEFMQSDTLDMEFIQTNGDDFVELKRSSGAGVLKILYLNLGAERDEDGTQDACDFGDMYQWGRPTTGHEKITWTKNTSVAVSDPDYRNIIFDDATAANVGYSISQSTFFLTSWLPDGSGLWHNSSGKTSDDPCPNGWRVPYLDWRDIYSVNGDPSTAVGNTWIWRPNTGNRIAGGMIVTYGRSIDANLDNTKRIFLPAAGLRHPNDGSLMTIYYGTSLPGGYYWSSYVSGTPAAWALTLRSDLLSLDPKNKGFGLPVRCIED